jgi:glucan biosynthesis protein C
MTWDRRRHRQEREMEIELPIVTHAATNAPAPRLFFIDHLRVALIILVVLHHIAVIYAANSPFYYLEPAYQDVPALVILVFFELFNQAYFMGFFFLLSGYFTPGSFDRKGPRLFLRDRLLRLGIPLLAYMFVLNPIAWIGVYQMPVELTKITTPFTWQQYPKLIGIGPLWFVVMLLVFDFGYIAVRVVARSLAPRDGVLPRYRAIGAFVLVLALTTYLIRIVLPLGKAVHGFPTLAYLPQYLSFFVLGVLGARRKWLQTVPGSMGKAGLGAALGVTLLLLPLAFSGRTNFLGRGQWQSAAYALWDSAFAVGMCLALTTFFRRFFNRQGRLGRLLTRSAFTVYVIHIPVIVLLALALRGVQLEHLLKFGLLALIGVPLCFAVAGLIGRITRAAQILYLARRVENGT